MSYRYYRAPSQSTMDERAKNYSIKYKKYIDWFDIISISNNDFLLNMKQILMTGNRKFTPNMIAALDKVMSENKLLSKVDRELRLAEMKSIFDKIDALKALIKLVDTEKQIMYSHSSLDFVESVESGMKKYLKASPKQMEALNKVWIRYNKRVKK